MCALGVGCWLSCVSDSIYACFCGGIIYKHFSKKTGLESGQSACSKLCAKICHLDTGRIWISSTKNPMLVTSSGLLNTQDTTHNIHLNTCKDHFLSAALQDINFVNAFKVQATVLQKSLVAIAWQNADLKKSQYILSICKCALQNIRKAALTGGGTSKA